MKIDVKFRDEEGNVVLEGHLNRMETAYLLQYAINNLMAEGVMFNLDQEQAEEDETVRFNFPEEKLN
jgi:hypothetical protein